MGCSHTLNWVARHLRMNVGRVSIALRNHTEILPMSLLEQLLRLVRLSTGFWKTFNDLHYWLRECKEAHTRCMRRRKGQPRQMPTRLLKVKALDPSPKIYLPESSQIPTNAEYATLSHFCGQYMPLKLEQNTLQAFCKDIDINALPPTFQEAIGLAKALALDYL